MTDDRRRTQSTLAVLSIAGLLWTVWCVHYFVGQRMDRLEQAMARHMTDTKEALAAAAPQPEEEQQPRLEADLREAVMDVERRLSARISTLEGA